jgi:hypothetical protein
MGWANMLAGFSNVIAEVDAFRRLLVNLPLERDKAGYAMPISDVDEGLLTGNPVRLAGEVTRDFAARISHMTYLGGEVFNSAAQWTGGSTAVATTMTLGYGGQLATNASNITTLNTGVLYQSKQVFPFYAGGHTYVYLKLKFTGTWAVTNTNIDIGPSLNNLTHPFAPLDGAFVRANSSGIFGVMNVNGAEQAGAPWVLSDGVTPFAPTIGTAYDVILGVSNREIVFWVDYQDGNSFQIANSIALPVGSRRPIYGGAAPFTVRHAIGGTAASAVMGVQLMEYQVYCDGPQNIRTPEGSAALQSGGPQGLPGHTQGSTALYTNNLAPGAGAALSNTAALGTGMGGQFAFLPTLAVNTDGIVCSYQNPLGTVAITPRNMLLSGYRIEFVVSTALTGTADPVFIVALNYGGTNVNLTTAEAANVKARRALPLGVLRIPTTTGAAPVGTLSTTQIDVDFGDSPIPLFPGELAMTTVKNIGAVTTAGVVVAIVTPRWRWAL